MDFPPPQLGALRFTDISNNTDPIGEYAVRFEINGRSYLSFVLADYIDHERELIRVSVVGALKDGSYLSELPSDTMTSGNRMRVLKDAPELVYDPQQ